MKESPSRIIAAVLGAAVGVFITAGTFPFLFIVTLMAGGDAEGIWQVLLVLAVAAGACGGWLVARAQTRAHLRGGPRPPLTILAYTFYALVVAILGATFDRESGKGEGFLMALVVTYVPFKYFLSRWRSGGESSGGEVLPMPGDQAPAEPADRTDAPL